MTVTSRLTRSVGESSPFILRLQQYASLSDADIAGLQAVVERELTIRKKRDVVLEGYETRKLHIIERGFAARYKLLSNGKRQVLSILLPGDIIGMPAAFFRSSLYSVTTVSDVAVQVIPLIKFLDLCRRIPSLAIAMLWYTGHELAAYADHIVDVGRRSPLERVAHFLLELHSRLLAAGCAAEDSFEMPLSQEIIGDLLGLSAPHVNRMLHQLKAENLISMDHRQVTFEDREGLRLLARFEPLSPTSLPAGVRRLA
jgi:CRP-like cAMP-binding protein